MNAKVSASTMLDEARALQKVPLGGMRAKEIAVEVQRMSDAIAVAATHSVFDDEPCDFLRALQEL